MRQGQQNRRGRGRSNRKGQSPLTRSFESTGPEVKIRGTPSHIAEKYMSLARDATSSGDPVLAENYLQHAEHYNRIIMAFRDQQIAQGGPEMNGGLPRGPGDGDDFGDDDGDDGDMQPQLHQSQPQMRHDHQPRSDNQRFEGHRGGSQDQNRHRGDRDHHRNNNRFDRNDRGGDQQRFDRGGEPNGGPPPRPQNAEQGGQPRQGGGEQLRRRDSFPQQQHEQPEFLRRPVRRPRRESGNGAPEEVNGAAGGDEPDRD